MRAIDADAIAYESIDSCDTGRHEHYYGTGIIAVRKEDIDAMPTIQPAEPKRGKWIDTKGNTEWYAREYRCSECGDTMLGEANYCPNCGADMRQRKE